VGYRADLWNLRTSHTSLKEEFTPAFERQEKKTGESPQPPIKTKTELVLKYQHQDWMLKEQHQNY
jgi:hypothetical protein